MVSTAPANDPPRRTASDYIFWGLTYYYLTSLVAFTGVALGLNFFQPGILPLPRTDDLFSPLSRWDGDWYLKIATEGYSYNPTDKSNVVFFPACPLLARGCAAIMGLHPLVAMVLISQISLAGTLIVLLAYADRRFPEGPRELGGFIVLAMGLFPTACFFRMAYTESLFIFLTTISLYGMARQWPIFWIAVVIGLATGTRAVGVGLLAPLTLHIWDQRSGLRRLGSLAGFLPLACWGLIGYALYLYIAFGDPLAFSRNSIEHWRARPGAGLGDRVVGLLSFEPVVTKFDPSSLSYWGRSGSENPIFNIDFMNPIIFLFALIMTAIGAYKQWLSRIEIALAAALLGIPYITTGYDNYLAGMGRFAAVCVPIYLVMGHLLCRLPAPVAAAVLALSGFLMAAYSGMFASGHKVI